MAQVKIGIIGAGSATFSMTLVRDFCLKQELRGSTVCFMDVDEERLEVVYALAKWYAGETDADLRFEKTREREGALRDTDFVINTALMGGHMVEKAERKIGEAHGYYRGYRFGTIAGLTSCSASRRTWRKSTRRRGWSRPRTRSSTVARS